MNNLNSFPYFPGRDVRSGYEKSAGVPALFKSLFLEFIRLSLFCSRCSRSSGCGRRGCRGVRDTQLLLHGRGEVG